MVTMQVITSNIGKCVCCW